MPTSAVAAATLKALKCGRYKTKDGAVVKLDKARMKKGREQAHMYSSLPCTWNASPMSPIGCKVLLYQGSC